MHLLYAKCMERGESIHHKLFKFFMMPMLMMLIGVGQVWGETRTIEYKGEFEHKESNSVYIITPKDSSELTKIVSMFADAKTTSKRVQIASNGIFQITPKDGITITGITIFWRDSQDKYPTADSNIEVSTGSSTTSAGDRTTVWTGSVSSGETLTFTNKTSNALQFVGISVTYTTTTGAVDDTAPTFTFQTTEPKVGDTQLVLVASEEVTKEDVDEVAALYKTDEGEVNIKEITLADDKKTLTVTLNGALTAGNYTLTINENAFADNAGNKNAAQSFQFTPIENTPAEKLTPTLTASDIEVTIGSSVAPSIEYDGDGTATYSGYDGIATFADGKFTGTKAGTATVTVSYSETENYKATTAEFTLTVKEKPSTDGDKSEVLTGFSSSNVKDNVYSLGKSCNVTTGKRNSENLKVPITITPKNDYTITKVVLKWRVGSNYTPSDVSNLSCENVSSYTTTEFIPADGTEDIVIDKSNSGKSDYQVSAITIFYKDAADETKPYFTLQGTPKLGDNSITLIASEPIILADNEIALNKVACLNDGKENYYPSAKPVIDGKTVTFTFSSSFTEGTKYEFTLNANVFTDAAGNENSVFTQTFTIEKPTPNLSASDIEVMVGSSIAPKVQYDGDGTATYSGYESIATFADGKFTGTKIGSATVTVNFSETENYKAATETFTLTVTKKDAGVANHWDFTSWDSEDIETIIADEKWEDSNSSEDVVTPPYTYSSKLDGVSFDFQNTQGLKFSASSSRLTINAVTDGNGYIRLHNDAAKIALPALKQGQVITLFTQSTNSSARGLVPTDDCKTYVELVSPSATGYGAFQSQYRVTAEGADKSIAFHSSDNGIYVKKIEVSLSLYDPGLKFVDAGGNTVTEVTANISDSESFVEPRLTWSPDAQDLSITYRSSNTAVATVDAQTGAVTFTSAATAGGSVVIYATSAATDAYNETTTSYTIKFKVTTSIKFEVTNVTGYLNVGFVEPQPVLSPAGLNVVKYTSSDPKVATVIENTGEVTFISTGTVKITASVTEDEHYTGSSDSYTITVSGNADIAEGKRAATYHIDNLPAVNGNVGNVFSFTGAGMIAGGLNITYMPGTEMTFGRYEADHAADWTVDSNMEIALKKKDGNNAPVEGITEDNLLPTGGGYFALEPVVSGMLALDMTYFKDEQVVIVDKVTKQIHEAYTYTSNEEEAPNQVKENHEFKIPLQPGHTYYIYNRGARSANGKYDSTASSNGLQMKAISYTPVFVGAVSHAVPTNNTFKFAGKAYYEGTATVPSLAAASHKNDEITYSTTNSMLSMSAETGEFVISDEVVDSTDVVKATITATMTTTSTHGDTVHNHTATATCTVNYQRTALKFSAASVALYITDGFTADQITEPTLNFINKEGAEIYSTGGNFTVDAVTGNVTEIVKRANDVVTATLTGDLLKYYTATASYNLNVMAAAPIKINEAEIELIVGEKGYNLIDNKIFEVTNDNIYATDDANKDTWGKANRDTRASKFFINPDKNASTVAGKENGSQSPNVVYINGKLGLDAKTVGTAVIYVNMKQTKDDNDTYEATPIKITVHVLPRPFDETKAKLLVWDFTKGVNASILKDDVYWTYDAETGETKTTGLTIGSGSADENPASDAVCFIDKKYEGLVDNPIYLTTYNRNKDGVESVNDITVNRTSSIREVPGMTPIPGKDTNLSSEYNGKLYKGIKLDGHASFLGIDGLEEGMNITMTIDNYGSGGGTQPAGSNKGILQIFPRDYKDPQDANNDFYLNRLTNVYINGSGGDGSLTFEPEGSAITVTNIVAGYPAATGLLNKGNGAKPSSAGETVTRTAGYATMISPYNIDMSGQKAVKAYICTYYGYANNQVHMKQIRHIPANTPVMLKGYARDMYVLYISEGNKPVDHGIDQSVFEQNRLVGALTPTVVNTTEEVVGTDGAKVTYYNFGLNGHLWTKYTRSGVLGEGRAYLRLTEDEYADLKAANVSGASSAARPTVIFEDLDEEEDNNTTTGIENVARPSAGDGYFYTLNGVRVDKPTKKGIYIYNGKKIVIR